ncbi:hypothetical protein JW796_01855 [Candidatus Dojkabacteria bacterium]|nr:hypothetical protein [Candidatus Dojkabacteria bacterium]
MESQNRSSSAITSHEQVSHADVPKKKPLIDKLFLWILILMAGLIPVAFSWKTFDTFESAKNIVLIFGTLSLLFLWAVKILKEKELKLVKTSLNIPILLWVVVSCFSMIFSDVLSNSLIGYYSRITGSFTQTVTLALLYFAIVNNIRTSRSLKLIISSFMGSSALMMFYGLLVFFGISQGLGNNLSVGHAVFSLLESTSISSLINSDTAPFIPLIVLLLGTGWLLRDAGRYTRMFAFAVILVSSAFLGISSFADISYQSVVFWMLALAGISLNIYLNRGHIKSGKLGTIVLTVLFGVTFGLIANIPSVREVFGVDSRFEKPVPLKPDISWAVTISGMSDRKNNPFPKSFFFGRGQETFPYSFTRYKPAEINQTELWKTKYSLPSIEIERTIHDTGMVGFIAYSFIFTSLWAVLAGIWRKKTQLGDPMIMSMFIVLGVLIISHVATIFSAGMFFIMWILIASIVALKMTHEGSHKYIVVFGIKSSKRLIKVFPVFLFSVVFMSIGFSSYLLLRNYFAETLYYRGHVSHFSNSDFDASMSDMEATLKYSSKSHVHKLYALSALNKGLLFFKEGDQLNGNILFSKSAEEIVKAKEKNPYCVETAEAEVAIYSILMNLSKEHTYEGRLLEAVERAAFLDPKNPDQILNLGIINNAAGNKGTAEIQLITAYSYRQDYWKSIVALSDFWAANNKKEEALELLNIKLSLFSKEEHSYQAIKSAIKRIENSQIDVPEILEVDEVENENQETLFQLDQ